MTFIATLQDPFPNGVQAPPGAADGLMTYVGRGVSFFNSNPAAPLQQRWSLGMQRELPSRVLLELSYVGNYGSSMEVSHDYRPLPLSYLSQSPVRDQTTIDYLSQQVNNPFYGLPAVAGTTLANQTVSRSYLLSSGPSPQFTGMTSTDNPGYSTYHSFQTRVERRFASGWTVNVGYTWSKFLQALSRLNGQLSPLEYVISDSDRPQRVVISGIFELPFGKGKTLLRDANPVMQRIVGGWQVQGIYAGQGGAAMNWGNILYYGGNVHNISLPKGQRIPDQWFNTSEFERDSRKQLGSNFRLWPSRLSDVRSDGMNNFDLSVLKNTRIRENMNAQFRAEFLNAFNHSNFAAPNTSPTSGAFGQVTSTTGYARRVQLELKLLF
jgi:hypothetical protein